MSRRTSLHPKKGEKEQGPFYRLFLTQLREIYDAEKQLIKALPKMAEAATEPELSKAFETHLKETKDQKTRLEKIFAELKEAAEGETCEAMEGLIHEGERVIEEVDSSSVKDAALIAVAQKVEHYEIASYGTLRTFASYLEYPTIHKWLQTSLNEEGEANKKLSKLAEGTLFGEGINKSAVNE